ncbi:alpha-glucan family phosphorylase [candidate division KSB1 bacterium]|nr:alpha-glucan family phosphorylase [candidate division KSB1 bacterium]
MQPLNTFTIIPLLPEKLKELKTIAMNLWWSWNHDAIEMFRRLDRDLWEEVGHNPVTLLGKIRQDKLDVRAEDDSYIAVVKHVYDKLYDYLQDKTWYNRTYGDAHDVKIAYFSAEFGLTECMQNYSGGLGVLAGDHLKSASELGLPLVGVGLLYQEGYFHQYLNADGWQNEEYPKNDFYNMPVELQRDENGSPIIIGVDYPDRKVFAQIWKVTVGRIATYLLDTNIAQNNKADKTITDELYGGDTEMRIKQEIMLGIGGTRALHALGLHPSVYHMNEGHSAFLALERIAMLIDQNHLNFQEARELVRAGTVFTTHTPVPAGIDKFSPKLIETYFSNYIKRLNISMPEFLALGMQNPYDAKEEFSMAILAINLASHVNGVSKLHGKVSRKMWSSLWPDIPNEEIPITSITNGIHPGSWISKELSSLYERYLGPTWMQEPINITIWKRVEQIPAEELWRTHERRRERLVAFARRRLTDQLTKQGALHSELELAEEVLNPEALTIGFARRFATYKRATLIFHDPVRLAQIMRNKDCPVQIIFAGKAHPKDTPGKELIRKIIHLARMEDFRQHVVFLEDYDMVIARYLVQGVDVWLNTPRRPNEASGTSGMKAALNGVLNLSTLDGWWDEIYSPSLGWAIGRGEEYEDHEYQDDVESQAIYNLLEKEVIPTFYERGKSNIPRKWIELMKNSMTAISPAFNTNRMVREYTDRFYSVSEAKYSTLSENERSRAKELAAWKKRIADNWAKVKLISVTSNGKKEHVIGSEIQISTKVDLGVLDPEDVCVETYHGYISPENTVMDAAIENMVCEDCNREGVYTFNGKFMCRFSGLYGYTVRVTPKHDDLGYKHETRLIRWAN